MKKGKYRRIRNRIIIAIDVLLIVVLVGVVVHHKNAKREEIVTKEIDKMSNASSNLLDKKSTKKDRIKSSDERKKIEEEEEVEEEEIIEEESHEEEKVDSSEAVFDGQVYSKNGIIIVNKQHGVSPSYAPGEDPEAGEHVRALIARMQSEGLSVSNSYSGFRSYEYQAQLYQNYVNTYGQAEADTFSARPGFSEHQTGLAFDLLNWSGELLTSPTEAQWLANHAHEYGFIVRYTEANENITGYMPEQWHIRYVGSEAEAIYQSGLTLEEYLGVSGGTTYAEN